MTTVAADALDVTFKDVENLVYNTVHQFIKKYGGEFDELLSVCHVAFVNAYNEFDETRGSFVTKVRWNCWKDMLEHLRRKIVRQSRITYKDFKSSELPTYDRRFIELFDSFSDDAKLVVKLVTETPLELLVLAQNTDATPKSLLKKYLSWLDWTGERITNAFNEIKEAL